jgi:hypothetical protein
MNTQQSSRGNIAARRIIQFQVYGSNSSTEIYALCDDGSLWRRGFTPAGQIAWLRVDTSTVTDSPTP